MSRFPHRKLIPIYCLVMAVIMFTPFAISYAVKQTHQNAPVNTGMTVVIDAGHGLPDGGATSCTGALEADINLEISQRLDDLFHLFGVRTVMTRSGRDSVYSEGNSIAQKKISDTKNRVALINNTKNALLLSIHQNHFYDSQYFGAQVFYADSEESKLLANELQSDLVFHLNPGSKRKSKKSSGVYIMEHIHCTGVLIECGFLSNQAEDSRLRSADYQKKLGAVIVTSALSFMNQRSLS